MFESKYVKKLKPYPNSSHKAWLTKSESVLKLGPE